MKALDTNVVVRFLVKDDEKQAIAVRKILRDAEKKGESFLVTVPVILETIWVLSSVYLCSKHDIVNALENLLALPVLEIEEHHRIVKLCKSAHTATAELADIYIGLSAEDAGCETTLTFDKKAAKSELFTLMMYQR